MNRFFKSIRRAWRSLTPRMHAVCILSLVLALVLIAFLVFTLVRPEEDDPVQTRELLFEGVEREEIKEILLHHKGDAEYSVKRYEYTITIKGEDGEEDQSFTYSGLKLMKGETDYGLLSFNEEALAALVVGTGKHYVYDTVISAPSETDASYDEALRLYNNKLSEYGLGEDAPYYELTTVDGEVYRVYYGIKSITGGTYYVRLAGRETIYVTTGAELGDLLYAEAPTSLVLASFLAPLTNDYAWAYPNHFSVTDFVRYDKNSILSLPEAQRAATVGDRVGYTVKTEDGRLVKMITLAPLGNALLDSSYKDAFLGKTIGACDFTFTVTYGKDDEGKPLTEEQNVVSVDYIDRSDMIFSAGYVNKSYRDFLHQFSIYEFTVSSISNYLPNTDAILTSLEAISNLDGSVVSFDFDAASIEKYKLYEHMIRVNVPIFGENIYVKDKDGKDTEDLAPEGYTTDMLFVSAVTERGTRYVGSLFYSLITEVDASLLSFVDNTLYDWTEPSMINTKYEDIKSITFDWNYATSTKWLMNEYTVNITYGQKTEEDGSVKTVIDRVVAVSADGSEQITLTETIYRQLFNRMLYTRYRGEHGLSESELSLLLSDKSREALSLTMTLTDNSSHTYRFIPVSADRVLVVFDSEEASENSSFIIYASTFRAIARGFVNVMEDIPFDHAELH